MLREFPKSLTGWFLRVRLRDPTCAVPRDIPGVRKLKDDAGLGGENMGGDNAPSAQACQSPSSSSLTILKLVIFPAQIHEG